MTLELELRIASLRAGLAFAGKAHRKVIQAMIDALSVETAPSPVIPAVAGMPPSPAVQERGGAAARSAVWLTEGIETALSIALLTGGSADPTLYPPGLAVPW
jgi:hypothetical protein